MIYTVDEIREKIKPVVEKYQIPVVYLFGSYARGEADKDSDIDLAVVLDGSLAQNLSFYSLSDEFESVLGCSVDVLSVEGLEQAKTPIGQLVKAAFRKDKILLYEDESARTGLFVS